jgi:glycosyltransferase involved in cell wall biosynthesis
VKGPGEEAIPSVGFVIPTHGSPHLVLEAIASVKRQTHPVQEIIVAVDGQPDLTTEVLQRTHPDVTVLASLGQIHTAATRNRAIRAARSDWLFFLDADDLAHEERVARTLAFIRDHPDARAVRAPFWLFSTTEDAPDTAWGMQRDFVAADLDACQVGAQAGPPRNDFGYLEILGRSHELMLTHNRGAISTTAIERRLLLECQLPREDLRCGEDWTLFVNVARRTEWFLMPDAVGFQRLHSSQHSRSSNLAFAIIDARRKIWSEEQTYALADYGVEHAYELRGFVRGAVYGRKPLEVLRLLYVGWPLIPCWRDRLWMLLPAKLFRDRAPRPRRPHSATTSPLSRPG